MTPLDTLRAWAALMREASELRARLARHRRECEMYEAAEEPSHDRVYPGMAESPPCYRRPNLAHADYCDACQNSWRVLLALHAKNREARLMRGRLLRAGHRLNRRRA